MTKDKLQTIIKMIGTDDEPFAEALIREYAKTEKKLKGKSITKFWQMVRDCAKSGMAGQVYDLCGIITVRAAAEYVAAEVTEFFQRNGYRAAMLMFHPDKGGETWQAQMINRLAGK